MDDFLFDNAVLTVVGVDVDLDKVPQHNIRALAQRALAHILQNEVASKVGAKITKALANGHADGWKPTKEEMEAYRLSHEEQVAEWTREEQAAKLSIIYDGTLGERSTRGPSLSAFDEAFDFVLNSEVRTILSQIFKGQKGAKSLIAGLFDDEEAEFTLPNGQVRTLATVKANWLKGTDHDGAFGKAGRFNEERIRAYAEQRVKEQREKAERLSGAKPAAFAI